MRSPKNNEKEMLKCLHDLTRAVDRICYLIETPRANHAAVIGQIKGDVATIREKLGRLDIRIGKL